MALLRYGIFLYLLNISLCEDCVLDRNTLEIAWEYKLQNDLKCNYLKNKPPMKNSNETVKVAVKFSIRTFSFDDNEEIFKVYSWVYLDWDDYRLKWKPEDYGNVDEIQIRGSYIWTPDFELLNGAMDNEIPYNLYTTCLIKSSGVVNCIPRKLFFVDCNSKLSDWPYDTQRCQMKFGEGVTRNGTKDVYTFNDTRLMTMFGAEYGPGWRIIGYEQKVNLDDKHKLTIFINVERQARGLAAIVVIPSIVVCLLTVSTLLLDVRRGLRLGIICFSLLIHHSLISEINLNIPKHSVDTPTILLFVRGSTILTLIVIIFTFALAYLINKNESPPDYLSAVNDFVLKSHMKYLIWPRWEGNVTEVKFSEELNVKSVEDWTGFANILNSVWLLVTMVVYVAMFSIYMPKPTPSSI